VADLLGEGEELIAGRRPVEEAFAARRESVRLLVVPERRAALDQLVIHATTLRIPVVELEGGTLTALAGFDGHQGVALIAKPRPTVDVEAILAAAKSRDEAPFVLVLDSLEDPQNFGTLLRSGEAVGVHGVVYPTRRAAPLSPSAIKASAGATEHLLLAAADDLPGTLADLHSRGLRIVGAEEDAALSYADADLRGPLALVIGSEGRGISGPVRKRLDLSVRIPMRGRVGSLNASVAGSVLLFAAAQQRPEPVKAPAVQAPVVQAQAVQAPPAQEQAEPKPQKRATRSPTAKAAATKPTAKKTPATKTASKRPAAKKASASKPAAKKAGAANPDEELLPSDS
jgi:23S rRNA (guanosine2251-2'-O)-methyltransferase